MTIPVYAVMVEDLGERGAHYMAYKEFCKEMHVPLNSSNKTYTTDPNLPSSQKIKERERNGSASHSRYRSKSESRNSGGLFEVNAVTVTCLAVSVLSVCIVASMAIRQR
jgi:hypothetical protein